MHDKIVKLQLDLYDLSRRAEELELSGLAKELEHEAERMDDLLMVS